MKLTEVSASDKLEEFRASKEVFVNNLVFEFSLKPIIGACIN